MHVHIKNQNICFINPAPLSKFPIEKEDKSTSVIVLRLFEKHYSYYLYIAFQYNNP